MSDDRTPRPLPPRGPTRLKPGADPWPVIAGILATLDSLTAQLNALAGCFTSVAIVPDEQRDPRAKGAEPKQRRVFGRKYTDEPDSDATGVVPPDPAA